MAQKWLKWCKRGCGKCVVLEVSGCGNKESVYYCSRCDTHFKKGELDNV